MSLKIYTEDEIVKNLRRQLHQIDRPNVSDNEEALISDTIRFIAREFDVENQVMTEEDGKRAAENEREEILFEAVEGQIDDLDDLVEYIKEKGRRFNLEDE